MTEMTSHENKNHAAQAAMQDGVTDADLLRICQTFSPGQDLDLAKAVRAEVLRQQRALVIRDNPSQEVDERAAWEADMVAAGAKHLGGECWEWDVDDFEFRLWQIARRRRPADLSTV